MTEPDPLEASTPQRPPGRPPSDQPPPAELPGALVPWRLSPGVAAGVIVAVLCVAAGFVAARVDLALVGVPIAIAVAFAWDRRPQEVPALSVRASVDARQDRPEMVRATIEVRSGIPADAVEVRSALGSSPPVTAIVSTRTAKRMVGSVRLAHSGPQRLIVAEARILGADASVVTDPAPPATASRVVEPRAVVVRSLPLPARLVGLTGPHASARPGDGGEFRDVDRFAPGDRLRRIDWKATARRAQLPGELYVRRTMATSDAPVQFVIDSRDDVTGRVADWAAPYPEPGVGSQDLAREAAASLATAYTGAGDRVGFDDLANAARGIPPRGGRRHLQRVLRAVSHTGPSGPATERVRAPLLVPGALVYVLSTFLDEQALRLALVWRAAGHRVIAVDVLPTVDVGGLASQEIVALSVVMLERKLRFKRLAAGGIDVLRWQDVTGQEREARLRELSRPRRMR